MREQTLGRLRAGSGRFGDAMMQKITINGVELAYVERGSGEETVVLSHSYLVDHRQFESQIEALAGRYRVIAYDHREHGQSGAGSRDYDVDDLVADAIGVIEHTQAAPCHFIGLSTGGFVGLRLALRAPQLLQSLVLMDTSAQLEPWNKRLKYEAMLQVLRLLDFTPLMRSVMGMMFAPQTLRDPQRRDEMDAWRRRMTSNDRAGLIRFGRAIFRRDSVVDELSAIKTPTLVVVGEEDRAQPPARARAIADGIPAAQLEIIPEAGHLSTIDQPTAVNERLERFFAACNS